MNPKIPADTTSRSPMGDFRPFALLVQRLRNPRDGHEQYMADVEEACKALARLSPLCKLVLEAIEADRADCALVIGEAPRQRYVSLQEAVVALANELMRPTGKQVAYRVIYPDFQ
jgi:hypothetical protein